MVDNLTRRSGYNNLSISVYGFGSTTPIYDQTGELGAVTIGELETFYPGGLYGSGQVEIGRDALKSWLIAGVYPYRFVIRNGHKTVFEGYAEAHDRTFGETAQSLGIPLTGAWGALAMRQALRRLYVDQRIDQFTWEFLPEPTDQQKGNLRRSSDAGNALVFSAMNDMPWGSGEYIQAVYTAPAGETLKRVTYSYDVTVYNNEDWSLVLYDVTNGSALDTKSRTTTGTSTGSVDVTLSPVSSQIALRFRSDAAQTPADDGSGAMSYAEITSLTVYASALNPAGYVASVSAIIKDLVVEYSGILNQDTRYISDNSYNPGQIVTEGGGYEYLTELLTRVADYGDSNQDAWAVRLLPSERARTPDGKPVLEYAEQPDLTDYEYVLSVDDTNIVAPVIVAQSWDRVRNWIVVQYIDQAGKLTIVTPDDDSSLADTDSIARYGKRVKVLDIGQSYSAAAINYGRRYLLRWRYSQVELPQSVSVRGYIMSKNGVPVPASEIEAGKRVLLRNFIGNLSSGVGSRQSVFLITRTSYDDTTETCRITAGKPDSVDVLLAQDAAKMV